jgi:heme exporter protein C
LDSVLRMFFFPAVIVWTFLGFWMATLKIRAASLQKHLDYE